ncbi:hypothetical protein [Mucilaginibacter agri]|uniref:Secreted protein n=1 Tax=Mucilaginibacter agri TaxID=2695265 RepID=A0A965ZD86_9SPHI|nr:hypothetical protein [Mucilaginibacter agri]NCD68570.1 hypothetical protein [Mucilaginibacter agri]
MKRLMSLLMLAMFSFGTVTFNSALAQKTQQHMTKSGKPDKRYNENKNLKKDGTPDMRYNTSKKAAAKKKP